MTNVINITDRLPLKELSERDIINYRIKCFEEQLRIYYNDINYCKKEIIRLKLELKTL